MLVTTTQKRIVCTKDFKGSTGCAAFFWVGVREKQISPFGTNDS